MHSYALPYLTARPLLAGFSGSAAGAGGQPVCQCSLWRLPDAGGPAEQMSLSLAAAAPGELLPLWLDAQQLLVSSALALRDGQNGGIGDREMW